MIIGVSDEDVWSISNAALSIGVILARTPLPDHSIINVSFTRRMVEAQESTGDNRNRILEVSNASEPTTKLGIDVIGEVLISDLRERCIKFSRVRARETFTMIRTRGSP